MIDRFGVRANDPAGPFGVKAAAEIPVDGVAAILAAIHDVTDIWIDGLPVTPERMWQALKTSEAALVTNRGEG